jgi:hypothetical protein
MNDCGPDGYTIRKASLEDLAFLIGYMDSLPPNAGVDAVLQDFIDGARYLDLMAVIEALDFWVEYDKEPA